MVVDQSIHLPTRPRYSFPSMTSKYHAPSLLNAVNPFFFLISVVASRLAAAGLSAFISVSSWVIS